MNVSITRPIECGHVHPVFTPVAKLIGMGYSHPYPVTTWSESQLHCEIGAARPRNFPPLSFMSDVILHHHTHWEDLKKTDLPEHVKRSANLIFLSDRVDALAAHHLGVNLLEVKHDIREQIGELRNGFFSPEFVDAFLDASETEAFWITLQPRYLSRFIQTIERKSDPVSMSGSDVIKLWAANHHEMISGEGYPFHRKADDLGIESRIVAVADVFQALGQSRPYRGALPEDQILSVLLEFSDREHLDAGLVALVGDNLDQCYREALPAA